MNAMWPQGTEFWTGVDIEHSWVRLDQAIACIAELEARLLRYEDGLGAKNHFLIRAEQAEAERDHKHRELVMQIRMTEALGAELAALKAQFADLLDELRELRTAEPSMYKGMGITKAIRVIESWGART